MYSFPFKMELNDFFDIIVTEKKYSYTVTNNVIYTGMNDLSDIIVRERQSIMYNIAKVIYTEPQ